MLTCTSVCTLSYGSRERHRTIRHMAHTPKALHSIAQGSRQRRVPWVTQRQRNAVTPTGLHNRPTFMAASSMDKRSVRRHPAFVKPRWVWIPRGVVNPGCAAGAAPLGFGMHASVKTVRCRHDRAIDTIPSCIAMDVDMHIVCTLSYGSREHHRTTRQMAHTPKALHSSPGFAAMRVPWVTQRQRTRLPQRGLQSPNVHGRIVDG